MRQKSDWKNFCPHLESNPGMMAPPLDHSLNTRLSSLGVRPELNA